MNFSKHKDEIIRRFHACATCRHFQPMKNERGMRYFCRRLGYHTKPEYRFDCWNPKEPVIRLMKKGFWQLVIASRH